MLSTMYDIYHYATYFTALANSDVLNIVSMKIFLNFI